VLVAWSLPLGDKIQKFPSFPMTGATRRISTTTTSCGTIQ
jgi:hypothetical protein